MKSRFIWVMLLLSIIGISTIEAITYTVNDTYDWDRATTWTGKSTTNATGDGSNPYIINYTIAGRYNGTVNTVRNNLQHINPYSAAGTIRFYYTNGSYAEAGNQSTSTSGYVEKTYTNPNPLEPVNLIEIRAAGANLDTLSISNNYFVINEAKVTTQTNLLYPENGTTIAGTSIQLNGSVLTSLGANITNATLYIWNYSGSQKEKRTNTYNNQSVIANWTITNLNSSSYIWNIYGCGANATGYNCNWAIANRTLLMSYDYIQYSFNDSKTLSPIYPNCSVNTGNINASNYWYTDEILSTYGNITCGLSGYTNITKAIITGNRTQNFTMSKAMLNLTFSRNTNVSLSTSNGGTNYSNINMLYLNQSDISYGEVTIQFNTQAGGGAQVYSYYNDNSTDVTEELYVLTGDFQLMQIKATSSGSGVRDALIKVYQQISGSNELIYSGYTDANGNLYAYGTPDRIHQFTGEKAGYESDESTIFIPTGYSDTIILTLDKEAGQLGINQWYSNCGRTIAVDALCYYKAKMYKAYDNITIETIYNGTSYYTICRNTNTCTGASYYVTNATNPLIGKIHIDGTESQAVIYVYFKSISDRPNQVIWDASAIKANKNYLYLFYFITFIIGIFLAGTIEKKVSGWGIYAMLAWFSLIAATGFPMYWLVVLPTTIIKIAKVFRRHIDS